MEKKTNGRSNCPMRLLPFLHEAKTPLYNRVLCATIAISARQPRCLAKNASVRSLASWAAAWS